MVAAFSRICIRMEPPEAEGFPSRASQRPGTGLSPPCTDLESRRHLPAASPGLCRGLSSSEAAFLSPNPGLGVSGGGEGAEESQGVESAGSRRETENKTPRTLPVPGSEPLPCLPLS